MHGVKIPAGSLMQMVDFSANHDDRIFKDPEKFARLNNESAFTLEISKRIGANIVETVDQVKQLVKTKQDYLIISYF